MLVSCLCRVRQRDFTQLHALCVSMCIYVYAYMYAICMRQRGHFTLKAAGTSLSRQRALSLMMEWSLFHSQGSAALSVFHALYACGSSGTFTLSLSRQRGGTWACRRRRVCRMPTEPAVDGLLSMATSRQGGDDLARSGRGALVALSSWPRRRASPCSRRDAPALFQCLSILALLVAWRGAWRGECRLWVPRA